MRCSSCILSTRSLQRIEGLDTLVNLEELWLGKNKLSKLEVCRKGRWPFDIDADFAMSLELGQAQET